MSCCPCLQLAVYAIDAALLLISMSLHAVLTHLARVLDIAGSASCRPKLLLAGWTT